MSRGHRPTTRRRVNEFELGSARVLSLLRLPLAVLIALIGLQVPRDGTVPTLFLAIWCGYASWSLVLVWWTFRRPVPAWSGWLTTFVDLVAFVALAATSAGATSYITPVFYLYPVAVAFQYRPRLTAVVGLVIAGGYVVTWLPNLGRAGGPRVPVVVWLYAGLLMWLAVASTWLTVVLVRRSDYILRLLELQRRLTAEALALAHRERARIAEDLHDGPLQNLIAVRRNLEELVDAHPESRLLVQSDELLRDSTQAIRGTVSVLHPQVLAQLGLGAALHELVDQYRRLDRFVVHTSLAHVSHVPDEELLFGTARELLANVVAHAEAANVWVTLAVSPEEIGLEVEDDGRGFDTDDLAGRVAEGHIGLASRTTRFGELGGSLDVSRRHPCGTRVRARVPTSPAPVAGRDPA